jgi:hypothetical protein
MDPIKREHDVEQWLDSALSQYGKAEPRTGLESRVLASLPAERNRITSRRRWWWAMGAVAAAAAIVAVVWVGENGRKKNAEGMAETLTPTHREEVQRSIKLGPAPPAVHKAREVAQRRPAHQPSREPAVAPTPKLDHFPSRRKMSEAEFLLARRLNEQSNKEALLESTPGSEAVDLSIGSLEISPLQIPDIEISESKTN